MLVLTSNFNDMQSIHKYLLLLALTGIIASCKKSIEDYPQERWEEDVVFDPRDSVGNYARQFLMNVYSYLPNHYAGVNDNALIEAGTDDAVYRYPGSTIESFVNGRWTSWNMPDNVWSKYYTAIRRANTFLAKIDIVPLKTAGMKDQWKAEARFLRAMSYFELLKRWGGVPLLGDAFFDLTSNVDFARNSYDECVQYIVAECDAIKDKLLKENAIADGDFGRITRSAAMALKARTLLYAASALNNTYNNATKWQAAAAGLERHHRPGLPCFEFQFHDAVHYPPQYRSDPRFSGGHQQYPGDKTMAPLATPVRVPDRA